MKNKLCGGTLVIVYSHKPVYVLNISIGKKCDLWLFSLLFILELEKRQSRCLTYFFLLKETHMLKVLYVYVNIADVNAQVPY